MALEQISPPLWSGHCPSPPTTHPPRPISHRHKEATELRIAAEPELREPSNQLCELATMPAICEYAEASVILERSSVNCNMAEALSGLQFGGYAAGLPVSIGITAGGSLISASSLRVLDSASAHRPTGSTPPALCSPSGSVRLHHPSGSSLVLCRSSSTTAFRIHASVSVASTMGSASALRILLVTLAHWLSVSGSSAASRPPGVVSPSSSMAPPSVGSTVGHHHCCGLGPVWLLLLQVPPVISLASYAVWSTLDSVCRHPPGYPSSSEPPPKFPPTPPSVVSTA
ncbi:hypothetical protein M9458_036105, partial [Cirrhinus mrigala]